MKKFLYQTFFFCCILLTINFILYFIGERLYTGNYKEYSLNFNSYLLSGSHGNALNDNTEEFGVYNFSDHSDSYIDMKRKLKFLIKHTHIDTVYITVEDHTLSPYREYKNNLDRSKFYKIPSDYNYLFQYYIDKYVNNYLTLLSPKTGKVIKKYYFTKLKNSTFFGKVNDSINIKKDFSKLSKEKKNERLLARYNEQYTFTEKSILLKQTLLEIIAICKKNNIVLIGVKFPLSKEYLELINGKSYGADKIFKKEGLLILDYKNEYISKTNYFLDEDHLNEKGGREFTKLLFAKDSSTYNLLFP